LATGTFLDAKRNAIFIGGTGTGKTHLCIAVASAVIRARARGRGRAPDGGVAGRSKAASERALR
jgi:DNA replication protein DnaC